MTVSQAQVRKARGMKLLAGVASLTVALLMGNVVRAADVSASQPTTADLMKQVQDLQAKVAQLSTKQDAQATMSKEELAATVDQVLSDADRRSKMMDMEGFTAGWDNGRFVLSSADGNYSLHPTVHLMFRNDTVYDTAGSGTTQNGFEVRSLRFGLDGNLFNKDFTYFFLYNTGNGGTNAGNMFLEQAWVKYRLSDEWAVRAGQIVDPSVHEQVVPQWNQLAVDRSLVNQILTGAGQVFTQGAEVIYQPKDSALKAEIGLTDGANTGNTDFRDPPSNPTDFGATGRVEYTLMGDRAGYNQFTALKQKHDSLIIGAGGDYTQGGSVNSFIHTVDAQYQSPSGLSAYGAFLANYVSTDTTDSYNYGVLGQVGYVLPDQNNWEIFGRYDWTHLDHAVAIGASSEKNFHEVTVGVNYYFYGQNAKLSVDGTWLPNGSTGPASLDQTPSTDNEFTIRAQFQLLL